MNITPILLCFQNVSFDESVRCVTGRSPLLIETFVDQIIPKAIVIMTTKWHGFEHAFLDPIRIHGSSIFMTAFPVWFYQWWTWFGNTPAILPYEGKMG